MLNNMGDVDDDDDSSEDWINCIPHPVDSSSDGIEFVNSNGEIIASDDDSSSEETARELSSVNSRPLLQYMYIQMEFCEKSTLRLFGCLVLNVRYTKNIFFPELQLIMICGAIVRGFGDFFGKLLRVCRIFISRE